MNKYNKVAIIGIACRFPNSPSKEAYWENLIQGRDCISEVPIERWDWEVYYSKNRNESGKTVSKWCGLIENPYSFDPAFFGISAREAQSMDPQQRISLETAWHAMEDAGVALKHLQTHKTSVYVGVMNSDYNQKLSNDDHVVEAYDAIGNYECILANRISYCMGLRGASHSINAACASSVIAMHEAKKSLILGESEYAIAGGVSLNLIPWKYISFSQAGMLSSRGRCRTFDRSADGYVPGDGVGLALMCPLDVALESGHPIYGVIAGSSVNHTGQGKGISAPRIGAQVEVIGNAKAEAGVKSNEIAYVEAHGTGTSLGDPIEVESLKQVYERDEIEKQSCPIGSVKTNIGHLEAAAGIAGVIKVLMMFKHKEIPPLLHLDIPNPIINFKGSPFRLSIKKEKLVSKSKRGNVAAVSSFGFGGANSHLILEDGSLYQKKSRIGTQWMKSKHVAAIKKSQKESQAKTAVSFKPQLMMVSAASEAQVNAYKVSLLAYWDTFKKKLKGKNKEQAIADEIRNIAGTLSRRRQMNVRAVCVVKTEEAFMAFLKGENKLTVVDKPKFHVHVADEGCDEKKVKQFQKVLADLERLGLDIDSYSGCGDANRLVALLSGHCEGDYVPMLSASGSNKGANRDGLKKKSPGVIKWRMPEKAIWKCKGEYPWIAPKLIEASYLDELLDGLALNRDNVRLYIDKARLLKAHQYTFKHYLDEWDKVLQRETEGEMTLDALLDSDDVIFSVSEGSQRRQVLLMVMVVVSLEKLDQRWALRSEKFIKKIQFFELVDLVIDGVLTYEECINLLLGVREDNRLKEGQKKSRKKIARAMQKRSERIDTNKLYGILNAQMKKQLQFGKGWLEKWVKDTKETEKILESSLKSRAVTQVIQLGGEGPVFEELKTMMLRPTLKPSQSMDMVGQLNQLGMDVTGEVLYPRGSYEVLSLPGYVFEVTDYVVESKFNKESNNNMRLMLDSNKSHDVNQTLIFTKEEDSIEEKNSALKTLTGLGTKTFKKDLKNDKEFYFSEYLKYKSIDLNKINWLKVIKEKSKANIKIQTEDERIFNNFQSVKDKISTYSDHNLNWDFQKIPIDLNFNFSESQNDNINVLFLFIPKLSKVDSVKDRLRFVYKQICNLMSVFHNQSIRVFICSELNKQKDSVFISSLRGLLSTASLESISCQFSLFLYDQDFDQRLLELKIMQEWLLEDSHKQSQVSPCTDVYYKNNKRYCLEVHPVFTQSNAENNLVLQRKTFLVVGGLGGLGYKLCEILTEKYQAHLIIFSRRKENDVFDALEHLKNKGAKITFRSVDILDFKKLKNTYLKLKKDSININGIFHLARLNGVSPITKQSFDQFYNLTLSKTIGTDNLDEVFKDEKIEFFLMFSSIASFGMQGSSNYSYACAFQNDFARYRDQLVIKGLRSGLTKSICWGQWDYDGAMNSEMLQKRKKYFLSRGISVIKVEKAFEIIETILQEKSSVVGYLEISDRDKFYSFGTELLNLTFNNSNNNLSKKIELFKNKKHSKQEFVDILKNINLNLIGEDLKDEVYKLIQFFELESNEKGINEKKDTQDGFADVFSKKIHDSSIDLKQNIINSLETVLKLSINTLGSEKSFQDMGLDSITAMQLSVVLKKATNIQIQPQWFIDFPTVDLLFERLSKEEIK